ncbi:MAG: nitronate monooxygenase [Chloroflexi bacterium]|nr:nitronate monooxygenase [Chloroflexota bacterium]
MFKTRVTEMFGIEYPILQGPIQWKARAELASAVSNAGGLGILSALTFPTPDELQQEVRKTRAMTDKPFAVNVTLLPTARPVRYEDYFSAAIEEGVGIIETSGRSPEPYMKLLKDAGVKVIHRATRIRDISTGERVGADAVTIQSFEAGGHPGMEDVASLVRIPLAAETIKVPVIAAGGIADARGFIAALALGAEGVLMGTRFLASQECHLHPKIKEWILSAVETDTLIIERSIKNAARVMKTGFSLKILEMEEKGATLEELLPLISGQRSRQSYTSGDVNDAVISIGQAVGLIHDIPSVKEIIDGIVSDARLIAGRLRNMGIHP